MNSIEVNEFLEENFDRLEEHFPFLLNTVEGIHEGIFSEMMKKISFNKQLNKVNVQSWWTVQHIITFCKEIFFSDENFSFSDRDKRNILNVLRASQNNRECYLLIRIIKDLNF